jgi:hypothetical protein
MYRHVTVAELIAEAVAAVTNLEWRVKDGTDTEAPATTRGKSQTKGSAAAPGSRRGQSGADHSANAGKASSKRDSAPTRGNEAAKSAR